MTSTAATPGFPVWWLSTRLPQAQAGPSAARMRESQHEMEQLQEAIRLSREDEAERQRSAAGSGGSLSTVQREEEDLQKVGVLVSVGAARRA